MMMQLAICALIYIIFYLIKNSNYIFSDDIIKKTKEFLSYDINFNVIQQEISNFVDKNKDKFNFLGIIDSQNENKSNTNNEIQINSIENDIVNSIGGIGGASNNEIVANKKEENSNSKKKSQNELDIEYLKENYKFKLPVKGTVTSRYGEREETEVVSANHQGIDIGADEGTPIYASLAGTVKVSSTEGEYGKHIDIINGDILTRYAHCSKLLVKEGQNVKQGQKIAEVGSTGNSTGPHLHFEIRRNNRTINPDKILNF